MTEPFRTPTGGRIDRTQTVQFKFDGRSHQGLAGDTLASALLANDVHLVGRSFKYHRPRGILCAGSEEPNALVTLDRGPGRITPNLRATQIELYDGLVARSQNRFPSLRFDLGATTGLAAAVLSAGFVYKSFMWPPSFWHRLYEPAIRRAAGLGRAPRAPDADRYLHHYAHCDVLIIGGGPAGLAAALGASATGARVILCDEQAELGGSLLDEPNVTIDGWTTPDWLREVIATLSGQMTLLPRTTAFGWYPNNLIGLVQRVTDHLAQPTATSPRERLWQVRADRVVLATGAIERPLVFPGNDRPGIMLAGAARTYLHRYGVTVGSRVLLATTNDSAYRAAIELHDTGIAIAGIVDQRPSPDTELVASAQARGITTHTGAAISGTKGRLRVESATLTTAAAEIQCDTILMSGGWTPTLHLFSQSRGLLRFDPASGAYLPFEGAVGACAGVFDLAACLHDGITAGGSQPRTFEVAGLPPQADAEPLAAPPTHRSAFVDFQNDVTTKDLSIATDEGFTAVEHVKRYTTAGMATDQGKTSSLNTMMTVAALLGQQPDAVGLTTFRPPYTPVTFGAFAGAARGTLFAPIRRPPIAAPDAVQENVGTWKRARCFPRRREPIAAAVARECLAVRHDAGMLDASTLGKIEVVGPDAAAFLGRLYAGDFTRLAPGRCRYAVLLGENGFIQDDGIVARLAVDRFHVTTTTGGAAFVLRHMEDYLQTEFTELRVWLTSTTEHWAVIAVQGPQSAEVLAPFIPDIDLGVMPHMSVREGHMDDVPIRLFRVSFTGEPGFEINLPPDHAQRVWDTLLQEGVTQYGTDAMHVLRAEKGYIIVGQETDGTTTPDDVGLGWTISEGDGVGKRSLSLPDLLRPDRPQLVGLIPVNPAMVLQEGAQVTATSVSRLGHAAASRRIEAIGHVTSAYHSATFRRSFALAMVAAGRSLIGANLSVSVPGGLIAVTVTHPVLFDKDGDRLRPRPVAASIPRALLPPQPIQVPLARTAAIAQLTVLAPTTRLSVRAGAAAGTAIGLAVGVLLPTVPCRSVIARDRAALWLGPDEWLVIAPETAHDLAAHASQAACDDPFSIVDVSHRSRVLELTGPRAAWCLNGFCALDLDLQAFPVGVCTRTRFGKAEIILWRIATEMFHLDVARSFVSYVWDCLEQVRLELTDADVVSSG